MSKFKLFAENTFGYYHPWSQDTYLDNIGQGDSEGICAALCSEWIRMRRFANRSGLFPRETFKNHMLTQGAEKIVMNLQGKHNAVVEKYRNVVLDNEGLRTMVAEKIAAVAQPLKEEGMSVGGATVTPDMVTIWTFITSASGFYLLGMNGGGSGHMLALQVSKVGNPAKIVLYDPNEGEVTWNDQYKEQHFLSFLGSIIRGIYSDVSTIFMCVRLTS